MMRDLSSRSMGRTTRAGRAARVLAASLVILSSPALAQAVPAARPHSEASARATNGDILATIDGDIFLFSSSGVLEKQLTDTGSGGGNGSGKFSPDGTRIVYSGTTDSFMHQIIVMNSDGTGKTPITNGQYAEAFSPTWSRDGSKIYFIGRGRTGVDHIWVTDARAGAPIKRVYYGSAWGYCSALPPRGQTYGITTMPTTNQLMGVRGCATPDDRWHSNFYLMATSGAYQKSLLNNSSGDNVIRDVPDIAPSGKQYVYSQATQDSSGKHVVYSSAVSGGAPRALAGVPGDAVASSPVWSPDGTKIAFYYQPPGSSRPTQGMYVMNADGSGKTLVAHLLDGWLPVEPTDWRAG